MLYMKMTVLTMWKLHELYYFDNIFSIKVELY